MYVWLLTLLCCLLLVAMLYALGRWIIPKGHPTQARAREPRWPEGVTLPKATMIIPMTGESPHMEPALHTLLTQDYPGHDVILVTQDEDDAATAMARALAAQFGHARHILAGATTQGGQKTHNQLAALATLDDDTALLAFCDSTHFAQPNFLSCLLEPLVNERARVSTGYHVISPQDGNLATLGQALCVLVLHCVQAVPSLRQPWGGAMAMTREAYADLDVATLWRTNIVDDVSLAKRVQERNEYVVLAPAACLETKLAQTWDGWLAWLTRQLAYPRFIMPGTWLAIGAAIGVGCLVQLTFLTAFMAASMPPLYEFLEFAMVGLMFGLVLSMRFLLTAPAPLFPWLFLSGLFLPLPVALLCFFKSATTRTMRWRHTAYVVGKGGVVKEIKEI